jgi:hypothetical protein
VQAVKVQRPSEWQRRFRESNEQQLGLLRDATAASRTRQ